MRLAITILPVYLATIQATVIELEHITDKNDEIFSLEQFSKNYLEKFQINKKTLSAAEKRTLITNYQKIQAHNSNPNKTWRMALNKFSHLTDEQFSQKMLMSGQNCSATTKNMRSSDLNSFLPDNYKNNLKLAEFKDWRTEGNFVTPVKNQGHCGSCWTFSSTGCLESAWAIHRGELVSLAEQQFIDCAGNFDNHGCSGGLPSHAFEYVHANNGIDTEEGYTYKAAENGKCLYDQKAASPVKVKGSFNITLGDEDTLFEAVGFLNPVSIGYQVVKDFRNYAGGVYTSTDCKQGPEDVNHAVLVVGYGTDVKGVDYWIIKNSWGADWGMGGYFWMERGKNMCGIATCASFPIVD